METAKLFMNGRSQAVRLPKEYRIDDTEVYVKRIGDIVMLIPRNSAWKAMEDSLSYFTDDFLCQREQPAEQIREELE